VLYSYHQGFSTEKTGNNGMDISQEQRFFTEQPILTMTSDVPLVSVHAHHFFEIFYVLNGTAKHVIDNERFDVNVGDMYIIPPGVSHQFQPKGTTPLLHRNFLVKSSEFERVCNFVSPSLFDALRARGNILKINVGLHIINNFESQIDLFTGTNKLHSVLIEILGLFSNSIEDKGRGMPSWLQQLLPFLDKPHSFTKKIPEIIADIHLSPAHICATFKKYMGVSMTQYILESKLQYAYTMLLSSGLSIGNVAEQCGFNSLPYFYKEFKRKYGVIPGDLRKRNK
jgi:AraC-like DNA-binding protein/uncharacterized RmlC-like cupin family protein